MNVSILLLTLILHRAAAVSAEAAHLIRVTSAVAALGLNLKSDFPNNKKRKVKKKMKKLIILVLSLALLIGSAVAVSAAVAEDESYEIVGMNIAHGDKTYVILAVDAPVADAEAGEIEVNYVFDGETYAATYWPEFGGYTVGDVTYPVFYISGISSKDYGETILVEAHRKGADVTPDYVDASVAKYLYRMLYREGKVNATEGHDKSLKELYESQIIYGAKAQQALWNDKAENAENQRALLTDRCYVYVANGGTIAGAKEAILDAAGNVTITPDGTVAGIVGWNVTSYDLAGNKTETVVMGDTVAISANSVLTPYVDLAYITFEDMALGTEYVVNDKFYAAEGGGYVIVNNKGPATIVTDSDGDKAITQTPGSYYWFYAGNRNTDTYNVSTIEFDVDFRDVTLNGENIGWAEQLQIRTKGASEVQQFNVEFRYYGESYGYVFRIVDKVDNTKSTTQIKTGLGTESMLEKFTLKVEYMWSTGAIRVSVDGNVVYNGMISAADGPINRNYYINNTGNVVVLDNIKSINDYVDPTGFATAE